MQLETLGGAADFSMFDTLRLSYWHTNEADDDKLQLTAASQQTVTILGFATSPVRVVDITDLEAVLELPVTALPLPSSAQVQTPGTGTRSLLAFTEATIAVPVFVVANQPSSLNAATSAGDYLIVSHPDFAESDGAARGPSRVTGAIRPRSSRSTTSTTSSALARDRRRRSRTS